MTTRRVIGLTTGTIAALAAAALLAAGGVVMWADSKKDDDGYATTASHTFTSGGYAIASDDLDVDEDGPGTLLDEDLYGHLRLKVEPHGDRPLFVGIARTADVERYLRSSAHSVLNDVSLDPFEADYRMHDGSRPPATPAAQGFWAAATHGAGSQTLTWKVRRGGWSVVVMNADGSRGVDAGVSVGATVPLLTPLGWGLAGGGLLLALVAAALVALGVRAPSRSGSARQPVHA
jgi:hypothetical protein